MGGELQSEYKNRPQEKAKFYNRLTNFHEINIFQSGINGATVQISFRFQEKKAPGQKENSREIRANLLKGDPEKNGVCIQSSVTCIERFGDMVQTVFYSQCGSSTNVKEHACTYINNP
jgi:hypothetical protein